MYTLVGMAGMKRLVEVVLVLEEVEESIQVAVVGDKMVFVLNLQILV